MPVRFVKSFERFTSDELAAGEVELEYVPPTADEPPEADATEAWNWGTARPEPAALLFRLELYREFLER